MREELLTKLNDLLDLALIDGVNLLEESESVESLDLDITQPLESFTDSQLLDIWTALHTFEG